MFEIDNPVLRLNFLNKVGGIEEKVFMKVEGERIKAEPEKDVDRTSAEGKASSVQFIHFKFKSNGFQKHYDTNKYESLYLNSTINCIEKKVKLNND